MQNGYNATKLVGNSSYITWHKILQKNRKEFPGVFYDDVELTSSTKNVPKCPSFVNKDCKKIMNLELTSQLLHRLFVLYQYVSWYYFSLICLKLLVTNYSIVLVRRIVFNFLNSESFVVVILFGWNMFYVLYQYFSWYSFFLIYLKFLIINCSSWYCPKPCKI